MPSFRFKHPTKTYLASQGIVRISKNEPDNESMYTLDVPIAKYNQWLAGGKVQDVFPDLTADQREFIQSGLTPTEWATIFPPPDDTPPS